MTMEPSDPLLASLADLSGPLAPPAHDAKVRARCHARIAASARPGTLAGPRLAARRAVEAVLLLVVVLYGVVTVAESLRLASAF